MASSEEKLIKLLEDIAKEQNYLQGQITIKSISSDGANYTTNLYLATISEPLKPDLNLFAKVANLNEQVREQINMLTNNVYKTESVFYTELFVNYERLYQKNKVPEDQRLVIPKFYGQNLTPLEETLVLENLEAKGYRNFDRMKTFNWEYAATAVQQLARLHALGMALKDDNPTVFENIVSRVEVDVAANQEMVGHFMKQAVENGCGAVSKDHAERLVKFFSSSEFEEVMTLFTADKTSLIHSDYRPSNLMHKRRNGKLEIIPLDHQTVRLGNPVADLLNFIFSGSDEEFRRLHYERLHEHYYKELTIALQNLHIDVEKVYPKKTFKEDLLRAQPLGLVLGLIMTAIVTVSSDEAPKIGGNMEDLAIKPNQLAQERINGIVKDFARWGVI